MLELAPHDQVRIDTTNQLLDKLYRMGLIPTKKSLALVDKLAASALCRRRLPVVMVRLRMSETVKRAVQLVEQGHVRVGPDVVVDPAYPSRGPWRTLSHGSTRRIRRHVLRYNEKARCAALRCATPALAQRLTRRARPPVRHSSTTLTVVAAAARC